MMLHCLTKHLDQKTMVTIFILLDIPIYSLYCIVLSVEGMLQQHRSKRVFLYQQTSQNFFEIAIKYSQCYSSFSEIFYKYQILLPGKQI